MRIQFEHSYSALAPRIYARVGPTPVANPQLVVFNRCLAKIKRLFATMQDAEADFTLTFRELALAAEIGGEQTALCELFAETSGINNWLRDWHRRLACDPQSVAERVASMRRVNPAFIPRNHRVEAALNAASEGSDFEPSCETPSSRANSRCVLSVRRKARQKK